MELSNLPDLSSKGRCLGAALLIKSSGKLASKYLSDLFNPSLSTLPVGASFFQLVLSLRTLTKSWEETRCKRHGKYPARPGVSNT